MATAVVASAYGGPEVLTVVEVDVPPPGPGEVSIRVRAAAVNPIDYKRYSGNAGREPAQLPISLGQELSGVVTAVGDGVDLRPGDEVIAYNRGGGGAYATDATSPATAVFPKPTTLDWAPASGLLLAGATAAHLLAVTQVKAGDTVLIHGVSGSVGLLAAQLALLDGARVLGTASQSRHGLLRGYGIEPIAYGPGLSDRLPDRVDVALDTVGTDEAIDVSVALVADRHRIATIVAQARGATEGIRRLGGSPGADPGTEIRNRARPRLVQLAGEGKLDVVVGRTFPLTEAAAAHRLVAGGHPGGKVVLLP